MQVADQDGSVAGIVPFWLADLALILTVGGSLLVITRFSQVRWTSSLQVRFVYGIPWGTLTVVALLLAVYIGLQGGLIHAGPVVIPFRAWSYAYPLGILFSSFAHHSFSHIFGNLVGTVVFAPIAEYAWGHYPACSSTETTPRIWRTPRRRIFAVLLASVLAGLLFGIFSLGPVIGFSTVVFAFAGFALVFYPIKTIVAVVVESLVHLVYNAFTHGVVISSAHPSYYTPWFANIALQGHAMGVLLGILTALTLAKRRQTSLSPGKIFLAALLLAVHHDFWAIYWYRGNGSYVLFRSLGTVVVFIAATIVAWAALTTTRGRASRHWLRTRLESVSISGWYLPRIILVISLLALAGAGVPTHLSTYDTTQAPSNAIHVHDYTIYYSENVTNRLVSIVNISIAGQTTNVETSGIIVASRQRGIWTQALSTGRLRYAGQGVIRVGGIGWRANIVANRTGWTLTGGNQTYLVTLRRPQSRPRLVYTAPPAVASPQIAGMHVVIGPLNSTRTFGVGVRRNGSIQDVTRMPPNGTQVRLNGLILRRNNRDLYAIRNHTRVLIAQQTIPKADHQ